MKIPKRFKLMGQTIEVTDGGNSFIENSDRVAFASYRTNEIHINPLMVHRTPAMVEHSFMHELVHFILYHSGSAYHSDKQDWMHQDEGFVDLTANLLHQALTTMEYD
jgi:predicted SprT family Zn-dependent metalloprotease